VFGSGIRRLDGEALGGRRLARTPPRRVTRWLAASTIAPPFGAGQKERPKYPENRCRTTIAERMEETLAELPFIGDQVICLGRNQAARKGGGGPAAAPASIPSRWLRWPAAAQ